MDEYSKNGKHYVAVDDLPEEDPCFRPNGRCAIKGRCALLDYADKPPCNKSDRLDGRSIHWEESAL